MNELHVQNPIFRNLIHRLERASETGQIRARIYLPILYNRHLIPSKGGEFFEIHSTDNFRCEHMNWCSPAGSFSFYSFDDFDKMFSLSRHVPRKVDTVTIFNV